jgi:hypothetical protein
MSIVEVLLVSYLLVCIETPPGIPIQAMNLHDRFQQLEVPFSGDHDDPGRYGPQHKRTNLECFCRLSLVIPKHSKKRREKRKEDTACISRIYVFGLM